MTESVQFCVGIKNAPGTLAKLCGDLRQADINIEALFVSGDDDGTWVNMIVSPIGALEKVLCDKKYDFYSEKVLTHQASNRPGELEEIAMRLSGGGVNINYVYGSTSNAAVFTLVLHVDDLPAASKLLSS